MKRETIFSPCRNYRYTLWREWSMQHDLAASQGGAGYDQTGQYLMVIGLNPSTADETQDDPTIRRCKDFAMRWGFGALCMTNLFAWRDTKPAAMKKVKDPVGPLNDYYIFQLAMEAGMILAAWGKQGAHLKRSEYIKSLFTEAKLDLRALRFNTDGSPEHPLYVPADTLPLFLT